MLRLIFALIITLPLHADTILLDNADYMYSGDSSLGDTFQRPVANGNSPPNMLSMDANAVGYDAFSFGVTTPGIYSLTIDTAFQFVSYLLVYQTSFDPAHPLNDILLGESNYDTNPSTIESLNSILTVTLLANTVYIAVATGYSNFDYGTYTGEITEVAPLVPEPSTFVLISAMVLFPAIARTLRVIRRPKMR
jgi:hypothetical protein